MLVLLSDFTDKDNEYLVDRVMSTFSKGKYNLAYIPSSTDPNKKYFDHAKSKLSTYGNFTYHYCDIDVNLDSIDLDMIFSSDVIYLSGGNTFHFLSNLKRHNLMDRLRSYVSNGGNIIGLSAGAIILSATIEIAKYGDENLCGLEDYGALGLVQFDFMPHWNIDSHQLEDLELYSKTRQKMIYTCQDGDGIVIEDEIELYGSITKIDART